MAVNYTTKYESKIAERFKLGSLTNAGAGNEYSFVGAKTIKVYSVDTVALNDFNRTAGSNRFGAVANLGDTVQEMTCSQDKGFTFAIDAGDNSDQAIDKAAGKALRREIDEVILPTVDKYRLAKWAEGAGTKYKTGSTTKLSKTNILSAIVSCGGEMSNALVPEEGRVLYIPTRNYIHLVQADAVLNLEKTGTAAIEKGVMGMVDGCKVVRVPDGWFPEGIEFIIKHKGCTVDPIKLQNYDVLPKVQGFDGPVVQGRIYFDSFVLDAKKAGVATCVVSA